MDDFRLDPISGSDSYSDSQQSGSGRRKKARHPTEQAAGEDEVILAESAAANPQAEGDAAVEDYYSPSDRTKASE
jgi:hypothetical protein